MAFVHKEHGHIGRGGKGLEASLTSAVVQNENSYILHKGKAVKTGALHRQERKALRDLTNKSAPRSNRAGNARKKKTLAANVQIEEWAAESIEKCHYFDMHKFQKDWMMVDWCMSELFLGGLNIEQSSPCQSSEAPLDDDEDVLKMEPSPEVVVLPPSSPRHNTISPSSIFGDDECFHDLYFNKAHDWPPIRLKEEYDELVED